MIDTHSHLFAEEFADDLPQVIERAKAAGVIVGTDTPIVMCSRADTDETKLCSIALGCLMAGLKK